MYTLEQLRGFVAVAEELHFGRAAERLRMTQPPLSRQIQKLERDLGVALFRRSARAVTLTPAGTEFLSEARRILVAASTARDLAQRVAAGEAGALSIGFTAMAAISVLPKLLQDCDDHLPGVSISLSERVSQAQTEGIAVGDIDLGLIRKPPEDPQIATRLILRERLVAAIPNSHPIGGSTDSLSVRDLDGVDLIDYERDGASYLAEQVASVLVNVRPRSRQRVTQVHSMLALVAAGRGIAIVPESAAAFHLLGLVFRPLAEWQASVVELRAAWRMDSANASLWRALDTFSTLTALGPPPAG